MSQYGLIFLAGIAASWHCVGMCGGFACALSGGCGRADAARRQLLYNAGRVTTYCFLGAVAGAFTAGICTSAPGGPPIEVAQRVLAIVSGLLIMLIGARFLGFFSSPRLTPMIGFGGDVLAKALRDLGRAREPLAPLAFGIVNGFLPCPLVYGFLAQAAASGDAVPGMAVMAAFGLGTFPAMLIMGGLGGWLRGRTAVLAGGPGVAKPTGGDWRQKASMAAGVFFMAFGLITLARGILPMHSHGDFLLGRPASAGLFGPLAGPGDPTQMACSRPWFLLERPASAGLWARLRAPSGPFKRLESGREQSVRVWHPGPASGPTIGADAPIQIKTAARMRR
jgi:sulfite exporter TauE/SafE